MLAKLGFQDIKIDEGDAHINVTKDAETIKFRVAANTTENASKFTNLNLKFDYLVILTHVLEEPNVYIMSEKITYDLIKERGPDKDGAYWLQIDEYRKYGKYWDQI